MAGPDPTTPTPDPIVGTTVGSFRIRRLLGRGGMGAVYLAEHPIIGSRVAIKFLHESLAGSPDLVGRFYDEARAVNLIGHENIVAIFDLAVLPPSRYYIVMEYLEGATLAARLRAEGPLPASAAVDVLVQLTDALGAAHERGVVHRDLKPENVFLLRRHGREDFVKLVDFGIAKLGERQGDPHTAAGMIVGTPEYMAPEACEDLPVDGRADVYALGIMAYELLAGRLPFVRRGVGPTLLAHLREPPPPLRAVRPDLPAALEDAVLRALEKRVEDRFQDMASFGAALAAAVRASSAPAVPAAPASPSAPAPAPRAASAAPGPAATPAAQEGAVALAVRLLADGTRGREGAGPARSPPPELAAAGRLRVAEAHRGGVSFRGVASPPPLLARVAVALPGAGGSGDVEVLGEVVRHVAGAEAARWGGEPGFAVQLHARTGAERAAIAALEARLAGGGAPPAARAGAPGATPRPGTSDPSSPAGALAALAELERRADGGPYELLGVPLDAGFPDVRDRARRLRREVEALRPSLPPADAASRVPPLLARLEAALTLLGTPAERLLHDARRGNFRGVAHCLTAGLPASVLEVRRRTFLAERPGQAEEAERHATRARLAEKLGNAAGALAAYEAALAQDPLDLALHQAYWALRRAEGGAA